MSRTQVVLAVAVAFFGVAAIEAAELSVGNLIIAPSETGTVEVSGSIAGEETCGVTILLEIVSRAGNVGTLEFTPAPPVDIVQLGDPWPGAGTFSPFDTDLTFSPVLNGSVDDNGTGL